MKISKNIKPGQDNRVRIVIIFALFVIFFVLLALRTSYHQIIKGEEYAQKASRQQTTDSVISAMRGNIMDRNGSALAISATANTVWVRPGDIKSNGKTDEEIELNARKEAETISRILGLDEAETYELITGNRSICKIAKGLDADTADLLRAENLHGVDIIEDSKRYYPLGAFASQIVGITSDDNDGITGLELYYNNMLAGTNGRWITSTDNKDNTLIFGNNRYYDPEDGYTLITTIDENIQRVVEEKISYYADIYSAQRVLAIVMDPKTGEILGMAQSDEFDLNNPRTARVGDEEYYNSLTESEQVAYWYRMWRNACISDVYEPGSTFKPITVAMALDYGVANTNEWFYCAGYTDVEDWTIHCWNWPSNHGSEQLKDAIVNSCNAVMIQLAQRIGKTNYFNGLRTFCITDLTGVDYPGEASNIIYSEKETGPVELATMSFGQGIAVTPISLISAFSSLANKGKLMQPHFVKQVLDSKGNVVENVEPVVRNITASAETADNIMTMLEAVVDEGGAGTAQIPGYRIGGKTGTSYKPDTGEYAEDVWTSFIGIAPMEDPQFVCLVVFDSPSNQSSTLTAAVCETEIMQEILLQRNIQPTYSWAELEAIRAQKVYVPDLTGQTLEDAVGILAGKDLGFVISDDPGMAYHETTVTDQYPRVGTEVEHGAVVTLYYK